jgi:hypothetical protein
MAATRRQRPLLWCALACALLALARGEPLSEAQCQTARLNEPEKVRAARGARSWAAQS